MEIGAKIMLKSVIPYSLFAALICYTASTKAHSAILDLLSERRDPIQIAGDVQLFIFLGFSGLMNIGVAIVVYAKYKFEEKKS